MISSKAIVILAGGESKRMAFNKEYIHDRKEYLVHRNIKYLSEYYDEVIVISNNPEFYLNLPCKVYQDEEQGLGPIEGLRVALSNMKADKAFLLAVDMPNVDKNFIEYIGNLKGDIVSLRVEGVIEPFNAIYSKTVLHKISEYKSLYTLIKGVNTTVLDYDSLKSDFKQLNLYRNINTPENLREYLSMTEVSITRNDENIKDHVVRESIINIFVNKKKLISVLATPTDLKEFAYGYITSNGYTSIENILDVSVRGNNIYILLGKEIDSFEKDKLLSSACGDIKKYHQRLDEIDISLLDDIFIKSVDIKRITQELAQCSDVFFKTGGVHSAMILGESRYFAEDIGRHNAVDKVIGKSIINSDKPVVLASSGRLSSDMVLKAVFTKISIVISRSAPTSMAIEIANRFGITLIGFSRQDKFNIYTNSFRVQ